MTRILSLVFLFSIHSVAIAVDWKPPENPDPSAILQEAASDTRNGNYKTALEKHVWYHENALKHDPAQYGVRLSFALMYWGELGQKYPPALERLRKFRDEAAEKARKGE